jgi:hypothetical protein
VQEDILQETVTSLLEYEQSKLHHELIFQAPEDDVACCLEGNVVSSVIDTFCLSPHDVRQESSGEGKTSPAGYVLHNIMGDRFLHREVLSEAKQEDAVIALDLPTGILLSSSGSSDSILNFHASDTSSGEMDSDEPEWLVQAAVHVA